MIDSNRVGKIRHGFNDTGDYILYWIQTAPRVGYNPALSFAIKKANEYKLPLLLYFELDSKFPQSNERHFVFLLEGLQEFSNNCKKLGFQFVVGIKDYKQTTQFREVLINAKILITDKGFLKYHKKRLPEYIKGFENEIYVVDSNSVVPTKLVSKKEEYNAYFFRKKITPFINQHLKKPKHEKLNKLNISKFKSLDITNINHILKIVHVDNSVKKVKYLSGGEKNANKVLKNFIENKLKDYSKFKNNPSFDVTSNLSPYLHFGHISPIKIALEVGKYSKIFDTKTFLEELIVRRELAFNFCEYNTNYNKYGSLPNWAKETLKKHKNDKRDYFYPLQHLEEFKTRDKYWNTAQKELVLTGKIHGYMRMYWGKKVIEWLQDPKDAFEILLYLNNKYALDGRDPNSYAGILWCFGKHDRPWFEREIFGQVRYMNASGLERKFKMDKYINRINSY